MKGRLRNMNDIRNIIHRLRMAHSDRRINKDLKVHRSIIKDIRILAITNLWLNTASPMPSDEEIAKVWNKKTKNKSHSLDPYKTQIEQWSNEGYSSVVIQQLLKDKCPCDVQMIRRYRQKYFPKVVDPVMVRDTIPGKHLDLDFGFLGRFLDENDELKKVWLFSLRLRHSRRVYREIVTNQKLSTFLMGHVHAFEYFNGVPENCIMDNLKAAVTQSTIDNDMISRSYQELAEHYGFVISPCLPRTPEHKGGVEGDVNYTRRNFLAYFRAKQKEMGIEVSFISDLVEALKKWNEEVADIHLIHGVGRSPIEIFKSEEEKTLRPLPKTRWEPTTWCRCNVRRDWRIMLENAYYSVPHHLIGEIVEVCMTHSLVRIFHDHKEITIHDRATKKWEYKRKAEHAPPFKEAVLQCTREGLLQLAQDIGSFTHQVATGIFSHPSVDKLKPVRHLLRLAEKYSKERLEKACERAFNCKLFAYASVKNILINNLDSQPLDSEPSEKIIKLQTYKYVRDPNCYKSDNEVDEPFEEKLERMRPYSRNGNAMLGVANSLIADEIMDQKEGYLS